MSLHTLTYIIPLPWKIIKRDFVNRQNTAAPGVRDGCKLICYLFVSGFEMEEAILTNRPVIFSIDSAQQYS